MIEREEVGDLRALSVYQPMAWAIAEGHKPVENRTKRPGRLLGGLLVLHGAQTYDDGCDRLVRRVLGLEKIPAEAERRGLLSVVRVRGFVEVAQRSGGGFVLGAYDGEIDRVEAESYLANLWLFGPVGWICAPVLKLDPLPLFEEVRGWPGVFGVPKRASDAIRRRLDEAGIRG